MSGQVIVFLPSRLSEVINQRLLTNDEAAQMLGVPERTLRRWRNGEVRPRRSAIRRMAQVFDQEPLWFCEPLEREAA